MSFKNLGWRIREALAINPKWAFPIFSASIGYRTKGQFTQHAADFDTTDDRQYFVRRWGARFTWGGGDEQSLYWNSALFVRITFVGIWIGVRLSANRIFQCGLGYKLSGYLGGNFRVQTDDSAAAGTTGPQYGMERGWWDGTH